MHIYVVLSFTSDCAGIKEYEYKYASAFENSVESENEKKNSSLPNSAKKMY